MSKKYKKRATIKKSKPLVMVDGVIKKSELPYNKGNTPIKTIFIAFFIILILTILF